MRLKPDELFAHLNERHRAKRYQNPSEKRMMKPFRSTCHSLKHFIWKTAVHFVSFHVLEYWKTLGYMYSKSLGTAHAHMVIGCLKYGH